jgi:hypothetical protein
MAWLTAIPDLLTALGLLLIWERPDITGAAWVASGVVTLVLEFFVVHGSGFFAVIMFGDGSRINRSLYLLGLAALYLLLVCAFAWGLHAWWMVGAFCWLVFGKIQAVWTGPLTPARREQEQRAAIIAWAASVPCFLAAVFASAFIEWPPFGVTPQVVAAAGFTGGGLWEAQPYTALAGGVLYFSAMAFVRGLIRARLLSGSPRLSPHAA